MKHTRKEEREQHIRAWHGSGLSKTEYCRRNGLKRNSFYRWFREQGEQAADGFIEITAQRLQRSDLLPSTAVEIEIVLPNGYRMNIGKGFDLETFEHVLALPEAR